MREVVLSGAVTGYAIAIPVGAVAVLIVTVSARTSWIAGVAAGLGVATVDGGYAALAVFAGTALAHRLEPVSGALTAISVALLLGFAALTLGQAFRPACASDAPSRPMTPARAWLVFVALTAINPATVLYFVAVVVGGTVDIHGLVQGLAFATAAFVASASWQIFVASLGAGLGAWISSPTGRRVTAVVGAVAIAALAVKPLL